jgi:N-acetylmuramoyl-L-alanine amidase
MIKSISVLLVAAFFLFSSVSVSFARPRYSPNLPPHPLDILAPLGFGLITGAIIANTIREQHQQNLENPPPPDEDETLPEPSPPPPAELVVGQVTITTDLLNVRSGPGRDEEIVSQVRKGEVLDVIRDNHDWLYIRTPDGLYGWIMAKFTVLQTTPQG